MTCFICNEKGPLLSCEITSQDICNRCCIELQIGSESHNWKKFFHGLSRVNYLEGDPYNVNLNKTSDYYNYTLAKCLSCKNLVKNEPLNVTEENTTSLASFSYRGGFVHSHHSSFLPYKAILLINRKGAFTARDYLELGEMHLLLNESKKAIEAFENSLKLKTDGYTYLLLARAYHIEKDFDNAVDFYYHGIRMINDSNLLFEKLKDREKLENIIKDPGRDHKYSNEKRIQKKLKQELKKLECNSYRDLGIIFRVNDEPEKAILYLKKALKLEPTCNITLLELAFANFLLGKFEKVIDYANWLIKKNAFTFKNVNISCYQSLIKKYQELEGNTGELEKIFANLKSGDYKDYYEIIIVISLCLHAVTNLMLMYQEEIEKIDEAGTALSIALFIRPDDTKLNSIKEQAQKLIASSDDKSVFETIMDLTAVFVAKNLDILERKQKTFQKVWVK